MEKKSYDENFLPILLHKSDMIHSSMNCILKEAVSKNKSWPGDQNYFFQNFPPTQ
jgi:hypothetical protein